MAQTHEVKRNIHIHFLIRLLIFWLVIFTIYRFIFLLFNTDTVFVSGGFDAVHSLVAGLSLDIATTAYVMLPSFLLWVTHQFTRNRIWTVVNSVYMWIVLFFFSLLVVSNIRMHHEWGALITYGVFDYLAHPREVLTFISTSQLILMIIYLFLYFGFSFWLYKKLVINFSGPVKNVFIKSVLIILPLILFPIMARGGLQLAPINESSAYFSETPFYNHVAINPAWYFIHSYLDRKPSTNPYVFMDSVAANARNKNLFFKSDSLAAPILNSLKPNIVIIILESWTADIIESLGGEHGITPQFDTISKKGLLFTQIYGAGSRTEHGLISVLSGYPPPPLISIITIPSKSEKLTSLNEVLRDDGYTSSFFYGGEIGFANMKSYLVSSHFQSIVDKASFSKNQWNSKWGAHDQFVFEKQLSTLKTMPEPFFSVILTLSSHEPFEVPMATPFDDDHSEAGKFRKAAYYSDHCLGEYFRAAKNEKWFDNTLFILVADHGHRLPKNRDLNSPESKRIPILFFGNVLSEKVRGMTIDKTANQNDIAATLLRQLGKDYSGFYKSKDILDPATRPFAYYTTDNVWGWVTPRESFHITYATGELTQNLSSSEEVTDSVILDAKAYLQTHYQQFLGL